MKIEIKNILRENLIKESITLKTKPNGQIEFLSTNQSGQKVGFALLTPTMDVNNYISNSYEDPDVDYLDPDLGRHFPEGKAAKFERLYVYPEFREDKTNRYGAELINAVKDYCKQNGINTIMLTASPIALKDEAKVTPETLVKIYQKYGFEVVKVGAGHDMVAQLEEAEVLDEDLEMHNEIEKLASDVYRKIINEITIKAYHASSSHFRMPTIPNVFQGLSHKYNRLNDFLSSFGLMVYIVDGQENTFKGRYAQYSLRSGYMEISMDFNHIKQCVEENVLPNVNKFLDNELVTEMSSDMYFCLHKTHILSTIIHELQHVYDSWRSKSKYLNTKNYHDYNDKYGDGDIKNPDQHLDYLKMQHEINSRFSQAIHSTSFDRYNFDSDSNYPIDYLFMNDFKKVMDEFKRNFVGFDGMTPKVKERLLNRFIKIYQEKENQVKEKNQITLNKKRG